MGGPASRAVVVGVAQLPGLVSRELGPTAWRVVTQEMVDTFADVTDDHYYLHVDPVRAAESPYGGTIAHGFLTVSLLAPLMIELLRVNDARASVNYGIEKVRFPAAVPVGARVRGRATVADVLPLEDAIQVALDMLVEVEGIERPAVVGRILVRHYP